jgi:hypothetical protein
MAAKTNMTEDQVRGFFTSSPHSRHRFAGGSIGDLLDRPA